LRKVTFLGTGNASATKCYNSCFAISQNDETFLVDAGGGNQIINNLKKARISLDSIHNMFISHSHTDHILGAVWIVRFIAMAKLKGTYGEDFYIYGSSRVLDSLRTICKLALPGNNTDFFDNTIVFVPVDHGQEENILGWSFTFFDIRGASTEQYGFSIMFPDGIKLSFFGDEPCKDDLYSYGMNSDYMIHEAFCLYSQRNKYLPYEKHHATVREACENAEKMNVQNLFLIHTEEDNLSDRKQLYTNEAKGFFKGTVYVPDDLDEIIIEPAD